MQTWIGHGDHFHDSLACYAVNHRHAAAFYGIVKGHFRYARIKGKLWLR
jgi:hypothetical protein